MAGAASVAGRRRVARYACGVIWLILAIVFEVTIVAVAIRRDPVR